ncbi:MAG: phosphoribosylformylglycinamidine synthase subunit PurQ [Cyanobacteria bacterium J06648_10]
MKFGVIVFPGANCDRDIAYVLRDLLGQPTKMIWHEDSDLSDIDVVVVPGGFSYGDYLRCGAIAQFSPAMRATADHAKSGKQVMGICNGFQVLTEMGLLPGALVRNRDLHFVCDRLPMIVERNTLPWTQCYQSGQVITLPIAHGEGCYFAEPDTIKALEDNNQVLFRYCDANGNVTQEANPNGSVNNIAGICNKAGNVLGMMPHPERAADKALGNIDGLALFEGLLRSVMVSA